MAKNGRYTIVEEEEEELGPEPIVPGVARALSPLVRRILGLNPSPKTSYGTNTYLVGIDEIVVIDPGPENSAHLDSVVGCGGDRIRWVTSTSSDPSHAGGVEAMIERTGAVRLDPQDGDTILGTEFRLTAHAMNGPSADHRTFLLEEERILICGQLMAEEWTVPLMKGDADLSVILESINKAGKMRLRRIAPVFGHVIEDPKKAIPAAIDRYSETDRLIVRALKNGAKTVEEVVSTNYPDTAEDPEQLDLLINTIEVHLTKLTAEKAVKHLKSGWTVS
jgi:glyoxylase-like metal-dependent hydrolase (beta-lactamase superfamily II)